MLQQVLAGAGSLALEQGDLGSAHELLNEALILAREDGDERAMATTVNSLGVLARRRGRLAEAIALHEEGLRVSRMWGDTAAIAVALNNLGLVVSDAGDSARAEELYAESLALFHAFDVGSHATISWYNLAAVARRRGDVRLARSLYERSLDEHEKLGYRTGMARSLRELGWLALERGELGAASAQAVRSLRLCRDLGNLFGVVLNLNVIAGAAIASGRPAEGAQLLGAAEALRERLGGELPPGERGAYERHVVAAAQILGERRFSALVASGRLLPLEEAVAVATQVAQQGPASAVGPPAQAYRQAVVAGETPVPPAEAGHPDALSPREREVLALLASGQTNREIAATLVLSLYTVEHHVTNIYAKIGARRRADAVAYALAHRLA
jgi:ATP/maltotriose-dependent transcriptional regulator MalT